MKKLTAFLLSILLLLSLTACGGTQNTQTSSESGGKVFVVYFSAAETPSASRGRSPPLPTARSSPSHPPSPTQQRI